MYRCITGCPATTNARTNAADDPSLVRLCPRFFNRAAGLPLNNQFFRAGVILHEMLHLLFFEFFHHPGHPSGDPVRRRDNAHCYEAFALRLARDGSALTALRAKLAAGRETVPLFDSAGFTRNLEAALTTIWERSQAKC